MAPTNSKALRDRFGVRGYRGFNTDDGVAFSVSITLDGHRLPVGQAVNHGNGGPTEVHIVPARRELWEAFAREVADEEGFKFEVDGAAVEYLLQRQEQQKVAAKFKRDGLPFAYLVEWEPDGGLGVVWYTRSIFVGFRTEQSRTAIMERVGATDTPEGPARVTPLWRV